MEITTTQKLCEASKRELRGRAKRLGHVMESEILKNKPYEMETELEKAFAVIKKNPAHILRWLSAEEIVLMSILEEI